MPRCPENVHSEYRINPRSPLFPRDTLRAAISDDDRAEECERDEIARWNRRRQQALLDGEDFCED